MANLLRQSTAADLEVFFLNQTDDEANFMAAFTPKDPSDRDAYISKWTELLTRDSVHMQSIVLNDEVVGCVVKFEIGGDAEITYAIRKDLWGKGLTRKALAEFLQLEHGRPIFGRVAFDNMASQKILEKNNFQRIGTDRGFANARGKEIEEFIYKLD